MDLDVDAMAKLAEAVGLKEVVHNLLYFAVAAWVHSGRVSKEIQKQMAGLINAINAVRDTLKADITLQNTRIEKMQNKIDELSSKPPCIGHNKGC